MKKLLAAFATLLPVAFGVLPSAQAITNLGTANAYNVFSLGSDLQTSGSAQGKVAAGGATTLTNYAVASSLGTGSTVNFVVGGTLTMTGGSVNGSTAASSIILHNPKINGNLASVGSVALDQYGSVTGNITYGSTYSDNASSKTTVSGTVTKASSTLPINFSTESGNLKALSSACQGYTVTGTTVVQYGGITLTGTKSGLNVFSVTGASLNAANGVTINVPSGATALINVSGTADQMENFGITLNGINKQYVLFNFPSATTLTISGISVQGSILAPLAAVNFGNGSMYGTFAVGSLSGAGQAYTDIFLGDLTQATTGSTLTALSLSPTSVTGGTSSTGTVTLSAAAPTGGTAVTLSSNSTASGVTVPASVTVAAGQTTGTFPVTTASTPNAVTATITATLSSTSKTATLTVAATAPTLSSVSLSPTSVTGGTVSVGTVTLTSAAPTAGTAVTLSSNSTASGVTVPASVTVASGQTTATFTVTTASTPNPVTATITATLSSTSKTATLTVNATAPTLSSVSLSPASVTGGTSSTGTVTLTSSAPTAGTTVTLSSDSTTSGVTVPTSVTVASGQTTGTFTVTTVSVANPLTATITATLSSTSKTATLAVAATVTALSGVSLSPTSVAGGSTSTGTVTLTSAAPTAGTTVTLSSDSTASGVTVPTSVTVASGQTTATFTISTISIPNPVTATITATLSSTSKTATLAVAATVPTLSSVSLSPTSVPSGTASTGTVTLTSSAPTAGTAVTLYSDSTASGVTVPASVTVASGQTTATFTVSTISIPNPVTATITGTLSSTSKTATLAVAATVPTLSGVSLSPTSVAGGTSSTGTVTLTSAAPTAGTTVTLSSDSTASGVTVPTSVTVASGQTTATFTVSTISIPNPVTATITGTLSSTSKTATLAVAATVPTLSGVSLSPTSVAGGTSSTGTVTLTSAAPTAGTTVALSSDSTASGVTVPTSVTVAPGQTTGMFTVVTVSIPNPVTATISATLGSTTDTAALTVNATVPALSGVSLSPTSVTGGTASTGTVTLTSPAPTAGTTVTLSSDSTASGVTVPTSVTVASGQTTGMFTVVTVSIPNPVTATISATLGSTTDTAMLTVNATVPALSGVSLSPTSVTGGTSSTGTVTLTSAAPTAGTTVALSSDSTASGVTAPASVTVASGQTSATFMVSTTAIASNLTATITGTLTSTSKTATLAVAAPTLASLSLYQSTVVAGASSTGTIILSSLAPAGGLTIALSSSNTANGVTVPASITIAAGQISGSFSIQTGMISNPVTSTITATLGSATQTAVLTVNATVPVVSTFSLSPISVIGGAASTGTVTLNIAAPTSGVTVALSSNSTSSGVTVPATLTIASGQTTGTFAVSTLPVAAYLLATINASLNGLAPNAYLTVYSPSLLNISCSPSAVTGGTTATGTVTLSGAAPVGGLVIELSSNNTANGVTVPASVTVAAGQSTATFTITTTSIPNSLTATITDSLNSNTQSATLTVNATVPTLSSVTLSPTSVTGGSSSTGTVTLTSAAPTAGTTVALSSDSTARGVTVPSSVTVPAGQTMATFTVSTTIVTTSLNATISATFNGATQTGVLTINSPTVATLTLSPTYVVGGVYSAGAVTLTGPAPAGGLTVALASDSTANGVTVPSTVTIPAGWTGYTFIVWTTSVSTDITAKISATLGSTTATANLTVATSALGGLYLTPSSASGPSTVSVDVVLTGPAPAGGATVAMSCDSAALGVNVPPTVTLYAGQQAVQFLIGVPNVATGFNAVITATYNGVSANAILTVTPPTAALANITVSPTNIVGTQSGTVTVNLTLPAPAGGASITLTSSDPSVQLPALTIAAGQTSGSATFTTSQVTNPTPVTLTAQAFGGAVTTTLTVDAIGVTAITLNPSIIQGRSPCTGTVTIDVPAPTGGTTVSLSGLNPQAQTPASIVIPAGQSSATFPISTQAVSVQTTADISAQAGPTYVYAPLTIEPPVTTVPDLSGISFNVLSLAGGTTLTGTVALDQPAVVGGQLITLSGSDTTALYVPASVLVPANASTANFTVIANNTTQTWPVTVTATFHGVSYSINLTVTPGSVSSGYGSGLTLTPQGAALGFSLSTAASFGDGFFPSGSAVTNTGQVLVGGYFTSDFYVLPTDTDGQNPSPSESFATNYQSIVTLNGINMYALQNGQIFVLNSDGSLKSQLPITSYAGTDIAVNPATGDIITSSGYDDNPTTGTATLFAPIAGAGVAVSPDGTTAYFTSYGVGDIVGYNITSGTQVYDSGPTVGSPLGIAVGTGTLANKLITADSAGTVTLYDIVTGIQTIVASGGNYADSAKTDQTNGTLLIGQYGMLTRLSPPPGGGFGVIPNREVVTRDDIGRVTPNDVVSESYTPIVLNPSSLNGMSVENANFDLTGIAGFITQAQAIRSGQLDFDISGGLDLQLGLASIATAGPVSYGPNQESIQQLPSDPYAYNYSWYLPSNYVPDIQAQLGNVYSVSLVDQISSASNSFQVTDTPQACWPVSKNLLSLIFSPNYLGVQVAQGRTVDIVGSGNDVPQAGTWDVVSGTGSSAVVVGASGMANGWDVAADGTGFNGSIVTVPANTTPGVYEVRVAGVGSSGFTVVSGGASSAPQMLPITFVANPVQISQGSTTATITLDAPAPADNAVVALTNFAPNLISIPNWVIVPAGSTSATFAISLVGTIDYGDNVATFQAEYNGYRTGSLDITGAYDGHPVDNGTYPTATTGPFSVIVGPGGVSDAPYLSGQSPFNLAATSGSSGVALTWNAIPSSPNYSPVLGYSVLRSTIASGPFTPLFTGLTGTSFTDYTAISGNTYYYVVVAVNLAGPSSYSGVVSGN